MLRTALLVSLFWACFAYAAEDTNTVPPLDPLEPSPEDCDAGEGTEWGPNGCQCSPNYDRIGTLVVNDTERGTTYPDCRQVGSDPVIPDLDDSTEPAPPQPQPVPPPEETRPTPAQCQEAYETCARRAMASSNACMKDYEIFLDIQVNEMNTPCFGVPDWAIWDTIVIPELGEDLACDDIRFGENSSDGRDCMRQFRARAMNLCRKGQIRSSFGTSETESGETSSSATIKGGAPISFELGASSTAGFQRTYSYSVEFEAREGINSACIRAAKKAGMEICPAARDICLLEAGETVDQSLERPLAETGDPVLAESLAQTYLNGIDREALGLPQRRTGGLPGSDLQPDAAGVAASASRFYDTQRQRFEPMPAYLMRLETLMRLSRWIGQTAPDEAERDRVFTVLATLQGTMSEAFDYYSALATFRAVLDPETGQRGIGDLDEIAEAFEARGGIHGATRAAIMLFEDELRAALGEEAAAAFSRDVVPSAYLFWIAAPMALGNTPVVAPQ